SRVLDLLEGPAVFLFQTLSQVGRVAPRADLAPAFRQVFGHGRMRAARVQLEIAFGQASRASGLAGSAERFHEAAASFTGQWSRRALVQIDLKPAGRLAISTPLVEVSASERVGSGCGAPRTRI